MGTSMQQNGLEFIATVKAYYQNNSRSLPWRDLSDDLMQRFYEVVVSEMMLQQTRVSRVILKYNSWMSNFQ